MIRRRGLEREVRRDGEIQFGSLDSGLFLFPVEHVTSYYGVVPTKLESAGSVPLVLRGREDMGTLNAPHFDRDPGSTLRHCDSPGLCRTPRRRVNGELRPKDLRKFHWNIIDSARLLWLWAEPRVKSTGDVRVKPAEGETGPLPGTGPASERSSTSVARVGRRSNWNVCVAIRRDCADFRGHDQIPEPALTKVAEPTPCGSQTRHGAPAWRHAPEYPLSRRPRETPARDARAAEASGCAP